MAGDVEIVWLVVMQSVHPLRVLIKALLIFAIANFAFAYVPPAFSRFSIFNHLINGRLRFPAQRQQNDPFNQGILLFQDMDALFASHVIAQSKPADEYRVILLGDSSIWGWTLSPSDILSEQINRMNLRTCTGKVVRVYDLAYPDPSYVRDLLILDQAMHYYPDLVVWPITMKTLLPNTSSFDILAYNVNRVLQLEKMYGLVIPRINRLHSQDFLDYTIVGKRSIIKVVISDQLYGLLWGATGLDAEAPPPHPPLNDLLPNAQFESGLSTYSSSSDINKLINDFQFSALNAGRSLAGRTPIFFFNEPIFIANGQNSSIRYNKNYPRWAYDQYRKSLGQWMINHHVIFKDFWNAIPASQFTDPELHLTPYGESLLANYLVPEIQNIACQ